MTTEPRQTTVYSPSADELGRMAGDAALVVTDTNVERLVIEPQGLLSGVERVVLEPGDANKSLAQASRVWERLTALKASRKALVVNIGGGMVTDLGGFAAATYKRGVPFINIPTTLLGAVDAAVGGKTGVNFGGLKNQVGVFAPAAAVVVDPRWFVSLPLEELLSGWGEMLKHGLIHSEGLLADSLEEFGEPPSAGLLRRSIEVKQAIVAADPTEQGLRKALNAGHTIGHAIEEKALADGHPVAHGYAVAWGLVSECALSALQQGFPSAWLHRLATTVRNAYGPMPATCRNYATLIELMRNDKKNLSAGSINFTLFAAPGQPLLDCTAEPPAITAALDIARDLLS